MCTIVEYIRRRRPGELIDRFKLKDILFEFIPQKWVFPSDEVAAIVETSTGRKLIAMNWGLVPSWAKDLESARKIGRKTFNAKSETVHQLPSFRSSFKNKRCLVPVDGYYVWTSEGEGKILKRIFEKNGDFLVFAGLWNAWKKPGNRKEQNTCTIITCPPNDFIKPIHHRMPVILSKEAEEEWINPDNSEPEILLPLLKPCLSEILVAEKVAPPPRPSKKKNKE